MNVTEAPGWPFLLPSPEMRSQDFRKLTALQRARDDYSSS